MLAHRRYVCAFAQLMCCAAVALAGCTARQAPRAVLAESCTPVSGGQPLHLKVTSPVTGPLRISVEQRGVSIVATVAGSSARSPIERFGVVTFVPDARAGEAVDVGVRLRDSPDVVGEVCISADRLVPSDTTRLRAERWFAAAGFAVQSDDWQRAFDRYLAAARDFEHLDRLRMAQARHAMAELAYNKLANTDGGYVLATWALADFGARARPGLQSALVALQARSLLDSERQEPEARRARVYELLHRSQVLAEADRFGAREPPRLDILRGFMEFLVGNTGSSSAFFAKAARRCEALKDWECYARSRQNMATTAEEERDFTVALQAYADALRVLPTDFDLELSADTWGNYGRLQGLVGLFRQSELSQRISVRLHARNDDCVGTRMALARLGTLLVQVGSIGEGHTILSSAASLECSELLARAARASSTESSANTDDDLSSVAYTRSDSAAPNVPNMMACVHLPDAEALDTSGKVAVFSAILGLREASRLENDDAEASRCLEAAGAYANTARTQLRLANAEGAALLEHGDAQRAAKAFERGLATADQGGLPSMHENRSLAYIGLARSALLANNPAKARDYASRSLVLGSARADVGQVVDALQLIARTSSSDAGNAAAISILRTAAALIEQVPIDDLDAEKRATWLATQHAVFAELTSRFAANGGVDDERAWQAFAVSEQGRARSIRYALNQATDVRASSSPEPASQRYHELMQRIAALARPKQAGAAPRVSVEALAGLAGQSDTVPVASPPADLQRRLAALNATVIEYAAGRDNMFAFVIDSEHIRVVPLSSRRDIAAAAASLYERLRNPESAASDVRQAARRVAELAVWPVAEYVKRPRVILIPDDALHTVPFAVLPWTSAADSPLLVQHVELSVMPSTLFITRVSETHRARDPAPRLELIGDPVFRTADWQRECGGAAERPVGSGNGTSLPRLPGSRKEVLAIEQLAARSPGSRVQKHLGCGATPTALREAAARSPALLHIATHGYVDAYRPRLSALALTPDSAANGGAATFGLLDILNMKIDTRLVVLSACDTSRGRLLPGEGVLGPAQAFLQAGAASVVASYWRIADDETAPFMQAFYKYLLVDHLTAAAALRRTQLDYARAGTSYDWAAFTLYGWPDTSL